MLKIQRTGQFNQLLDERCFEDPELALLINKKIILFQRNPQDTRLDNHALTKKMQGKWAFSITGDLRIIYEWVGRTTVRFLDIGPHIKVYPKSKKQSPKR